MQHGPGQSITWVQNRSAAPKAETPQDLEDTPGMFSEPGQERDLCRHWGSAEMKHWAVWGCKPVKGDRDRI